MKKKLSIFQYPQRIYLTTSCRSGGATAKRIRSFLSQRSAFSKKSNSGFSLVEILVACSIMLLAMFSILVLAKKSITLSRQALHQTQASFLLEEGAEAVKIVRDNGWTNITGLTNGTTYYPTFSGSTWTLSTTPATSGIFTRTAVSSAVYRNGSNDIAASGTLDSGTRKITVTTSWSESGTTRSKSVSFYISNI